jgi:hypothetical protein
VASILLLEGGASPGRLGSKENPVRRTALGLSLTAMLLAGASASHASGLDLRIGGFFPRGSGILWTDDCMLYELRGCAEVRPGEFGYHSYGGDLKGLTGGIEVATEIAPNFELGVHMDGYGQTVHTSYRAHREDGAPIRQRLRISTLPLGTTLRLVPTSKRARFAPYVGVGVDAVLYWYKEEGDFIDFYDPELPIISDSFHSYGAAFGAHAALGLRVYLNRDFALVGEGRYQWTADHRMGGDFAPNEPGLVNKIDLSGASLLLGLHVRF